MCGPWSVHYICNNTKQHVIEWLGRVSFKPFGTVFTAATAQAAYVRGIIVHWYASSMPRVHLCKIFDSKVQIEKSRVGWWRKSQRTGSTGNFLDARLLVVISWFHEVGRTQGWELDSTDRWWTIHTVAEGRRPWSRTWRNGVKVIHGREEEVKYGRSRLTGTKPDWNRNTTNNNIRGVTKDALLFDRWRSRQAEKCRYARG